MLHHRRRDRSGRPRLGLLFNNGTLGLAGFMVLLLGTGDKASLFLGYAIGSALMLVAAVVAWMWGVAAEQESLADIAEPLSATSAEPA